jgi:hypothetical protein
MSGPRRQREVEEHPGFAGGRRAFGGLGAISLTRPESSLLMSTPFFGTVLTHLKRGRRPRTA